MFKRKNLDIIKDVFKDVQDVPQSTLNDILSDLEKSGLKNGDLRQALFDMADEVTKRIEKLDDDSLNKRNQKAAEQLEYEARLAEKTYALNQELSDRLAQLRSENAVQILEDETHVTEETIKKKNKLLENNEKRRLAKEKEKAQKNGTLSDENKQLFAQIEAEIHNKYTHITEVQIANFMKKKMEELEQFYKDLTGKEFKNSQDYSRLRPDNFELKKAAIRSETDYEIEKIHDDYDKREDDGSNPDIDYQRLEKARIAAIENARREGNAKLLKAETEHYNSINALTEEHFDIAMKYLEAEMHQRILATDDPKLQAELKWQAEGIKNYQEEKKLLEQLAVARQKLNNLETNHQDGENSIVTEKEVADAKKNVADLILQINKLLAARRAMELARKKQQKEERNRILNEVNFTTGNIDKSIQAIGSVANAYIEAEQQKTSVLIAEQQKRVDRAKEIAKGGNTEMLKAEEDRLAAMEKKQREYVHKQKQLNAILIASQQAVNITQAITGVLSSTAGDPYSLPARVIAAVASIIAGVAAVTVALSDINSKTGYARGGYTGDGGRYDEAGVVHKGEYVMPQDTVQRYGREALAAIHYGRIPIEALTGNMMSVNYSGMLQTQNSSRADKTYDMRRLEQKFDLLLEAYGNSGGTQLTINENGFVAIYDQHVKNKTRINKLR